MRRHFGILIILLFFGILLVGCNNAQYSTPTAIPTLTSVNADSESCQGKIQASMPVVVRPEGVGGTDNTEYGYFATDAKAASTSAGILVTWHTGIDGQYPVPNGYVRLLDDNAQPIEDMSILFQRSVVQTPNFVSTENGALLTYCGVYEGGGHISSAILDFNGKLIAEQRRFSEEPSDCGDPDASAIWTGSRLLSAWSPQSYGPDGPNNYVLLDVADANGNNLFEKKFNPDAMLEPHLAFGHGRILMTVSTRTGSDFLNGNNRGLTHLVVHRFDMEGNELGEPVVLDQPGEWEFGNSSVVPTRDGWLLLAEASLQGANYYFAHLAPDGSLVSGPELVNSGTGIGFIDVVPYAGGAASLDGQKIYFFRLMGLSHMSGNQVRMNIWAGVVWLYTRDVYL